MIKVLKHGIKTFVGKCSTCGCEFEYGLSDLDYGKVKCPDCGETFYHPRQDKVLDNNLFTPFRYCSNALFTGARPNEDCVGCPTYEKLEKGEPVIGDLSCTWCQGSWQKKK